MRLRPFMRLSSALLAAALLALPAGAQDEASAERPTITVAPDAVVPGGNTAAQSELGKPTLNAVDQRTGLDRLFAAIDGAFATGVEAMYGVLFYSVGGAEREYVEYSREEEFVRTAGTQDPFRPLAAYDRTLPVELTVADVARLRLQGDIAAGTATEPLLGEINGKAVDYLVVRVDHDDPPIVSGSKYVREGDVWRLQTARRGLLSDDETLTDEQVAELAGIWTASGDDYVQTETVGALPLIVLWLVFGALFFTLRMMFVNLWAFGHAVQIVRGKYDDPEEDGEVTHAQALASALSATVGLGNIAGVTIAMTIGGPGAFFWMLLCGFFGMASKFVECTLAQKYRTLDGEGHVLGGPFSYLSAGLAEKGLRPLGLVLATVFAVMCIGASFGGGIMFQSNQSAEAVVKVLQQDALDRVAAIDGEMDTAAADEDGVRYTALRDERAALTTDVAATNTLVRLVFGIGMAGFVALVIVGGIRRIGATAAKIVPLMCAIYLAACLWVIGSHLGDVPTLAASVVTEAFSGDALGGGLVGVLIVATMGLRRAAFSNEAGIGSAAIAHSAAKTSEPIREGCVAMLGPFLDTIVVCSMTALVVLITGAWDNQTWVLGRGLEGSALLSEAFRTEIVWFPYVLAIATVLFAFSSIISWSYYGEKATQYLFGRRAVPVYKVTAILAVFVGAIVTNLGAIIDFSDMMLLSMAVPNILGAILLSGLVRRELDDYWARYKSGAFDEVAASDE